MKYPKYLEKGMKFNRLTVIEVDENSKDRNNKKVKPYAWRYACRCSCGRIKSIIRDNLVSGHTKSCGCLHKESVFKRKGNKIEILEDHVKIFLSNCDKFALIDREDLEKVKSYTWSLDSYGYADTRNTDSKHIKLHRLIMGCPDNKEVDHRDHNTLDNRKQNLRIVTRSQNNMNHKLRSDNTSGQTGVSWKKDNRKWEAYIRFNYNHIHLGKFKKKEDAVIARKNAEIKYFGEYRNML